MGFRFQQIFGEFGEPFPLRIFDHLLGEITMGGGKAAVVCAGPPLALVERGRSNDPFPLLLNRCAILRHSFRHVVKQLVIRYLIDVVEGRDERRRH